MTNDGMISESSRRSFSDRRAGATYSPPPTHGSVDRATRCAQRRAAEVLARLLAVGGTILAGLVLASPGLAGPAQASGDESEAEAEEAEALARLTPIVETYQALEREREAFEVTAPRQSAARASRDPRQAYTLACAHALRGEPESALTWLRFAVAWGLDSPDLLREDPWLAKVRASVLREEWDGLLAKAQPATESLQLTPETVKFGPWPEEIRKLAAHPTRPIVALGLETGALDLVDLRSRRTLRRLTMELDLHGELRFLQAGELVVARCKGDRVRLWRVDSGEVLTSTELSPHDPDDGTRPYLRLRVAKSGNALALLATGADLRVATQAEGWRFVSLPDAPAEVRDVCWDGAGERLFAIDGQGRLWRGPANPGPWSLVRSSPISDSAMRLTLSPDGDELAVSGWSRGIALVRVSGHTAPRRFERSSFLGDPGAFHTLFAPDGRSLLVSAGAGYLWSVARDTLETSWEVQLGGGTSLALEPAFLPGGQRLLLRLNGGDRGQVRSAATGELVGSFPSQPGAHSSWPIGDSLVVSVFGGNLFLTPVGAPDWELVHGRTFRGAQVWVTRDGDFAVDAAATALDCQYRVGGPWNAFRRLPPERYRPHRVRLALERLLAAP